MMFEIRGYKAFNKDQTNRYGFYFEEGKTYYATGEITFGNNGNGFHMCTHLSDVFRYFDFQEEVTVAIVTGRGKHQQYDDLYYGYFDMYVVEEITIECFLTREEILNIILNSIPSDIKKFIMTFSLNELEIVTMIRHLLGQRDLIEAILYYQCNKRDIYYLSSYERESEIQKVLKYLQEQTKANKKSSL